MLIPHWHFLGEASPKLSTYCLRRFSASCSFGLAQDRLHQVAEAAAPQPCRETSMSEVSDQLRAAALARARSLQAARKAFISARSTTIRLATPLYFFVVPVTVRLTAPWWTRP